MAAVVEVRDLCKDYGRHRAVRGVDLRVEAGSIHGLIGPNGAGKTTIMRTLVDVLRPTSGTVRVFGRVPRDSGPPARRRIGYLPGDLRLTTRATGRAWLAHLASMSGPVTPGTVDALAERLGVDLSRPARALSKGNRQKLGLIQAFMHHPDLLVLDEPTSGLDPLVQREFLAMVREARDSGQSVLLSSHVLSEIQHTADDVSVLAHGLVVARGDVATLRLGGTARVRAVVEPPGSGGRGAEGRDPEDGADARASGAAAVRAALGESGALDDLEVEAASGGLVRVAGSMRGDADATLKALARFTVRDVTIEEPDLEEAVLDLYSRRADS